jgi:hypothetical protein
MRKQVNYCDDIIDEEFMLDFESKDDEENKSSVALAPRSRRRGRKPRET